MDNVVSRYLLKIGLSEEFLPYFESGVFKDYQYNKVINEYRSTFLLDDLLPLKVYLALFKTQENFERTGGFKSNLSFSYGRVSYQAIKQLVEEYIDVFDLYDVYEYEINVDKIYLKYQEEEIRTDPLSAFSDFLRRIGSGYSVLSYKIMPEEDEEAMYDDDEESHRSYLDSIENDDIDFDDEDIALVDYKAEAIKASKERQEARKQAEERKRIRSSYIPSQIADYKKHDNVVVEGKIFKTDIRKNNFYVTFVVYISDGTRALMAEKSMKVSNKSDTVGEANLMMKKFTVGTKVKIYGSATINKRNEYYLKVGGKGIVLSENIDEELVDEEELKRVELHVHTKMSAMDGVSTIGEYIRLAKSLGHEAIGLTDHGVVQSFPEAQQASKANGVKVLYGSELYMVDDELEIITNPSDDSLKDATYVIFDLETTGLSARYDRIIEFGAVKIRNGMEIDSIRDMFIKPGRELGEIITTLTGITNEMVKDGYDIVPALEKINKFLEGSILVSHNASFDVGFLNEALKNNGFAQLKNPIIDTLALSRFVFPRQRSHALGAIARSLDVEYDESSAHRAIYDAEVLNSVYEGLLNEVASGHNIKTHRDLATLNSTEVLLNARPIHVTVFAKNTQGLKDLYRIISDSNIHYYSTYPLVPRSLLAANRENLLIGSACQNGDVFQSSITRASEITKKKMEFYDFIEVQPPACYSNLIENGQIASYEILHKILRDLINDAREIGKMVVATGDVHYTRPDKKIFRDVYIFAKGLKGARHPLNPYRRDHQNEYPNPDQHYLTTKEMKEAFSFLLDPTLIQEIVVTNTNIIKDSCQFIDPIKDKLYTPTIKNCAEDLVKLVYDTAHELYGDPLPAVISDRLEAELKGIRENNYFVIYYIASILVQRTNKAGFLVGSRGSVGSSFIATMAKITEVNPLAPHYRCPKCKNLEWVDANIYRSGFDLPRKTCPKCGTEYVRDGQNIPFAVFLGFNAEKVPDIDLNFPSNFQAQAHLMTKDLLGADNVYKAGTIETVAEKTAYGYAKGYYEHFGKDLEKDVDNADLEYIASGCVDVKRTTGQHPGGIIVIPADMSVYDFTPIQYPANSSDSEWKTTHLDFHAIHDNVLKLDLLGHVDPYALKMMADFTGVNIYDIPFDDKEVLSLFTSTRALKFKVNLPAGYENYEPGIGSIGVPEFGTDFVKQILIETKPRNFADLLIISGLSHGTDVYAGTADELIKNQGFTLREVIGCRDDIMTTLHDKYGMDYKDTFQIMEIVRKGNFAKPAFAEKRARYESIMREHKVPEPYIESCARIKYLFPKAHAVAYCMMGIRVGWFKVYKPLAFYATFFALRSAQFDLRAMIGGVKTIVARMKKIDEQPKFRRDVKENAVYATLTVALEAARRGVKISPISITKSEATSFVIDEKNNLLIPPFSLLSGLGNQVAESIVEARKKSPFISEEDLLARSRIGESKLEDIKRNYSEEFDLEGLPESDQLTLF